MNEYKQVNPVVVHNIFLDMVEWCDLMRYLRKVRKGNGKWTNHRKLVFSFHSNIDGDSGERISYLSLYKNEELLKSLAERTEIKGENIYHMDGIQKKKKCTEHRVQWLTDRYKRIKFSFHFHLSYLILFLTITILIINPFQLISIPDYPIEIIHSIKTTEKRTFQNLTAV